MASTYSTLKIELMGTGDKVGTWGVTNNINLGTAIEEAITGSATVTFASTTVTLTLTDVNTTQTARNLRLNLTGTSGGAQNLIVPAIEKLYLINNGCADTITVKNATGTGAAVAAGKSVFVYNDGTNVGFADTAAPTTIPNLTGDVTSVGLATTLTNAPVIAKVLTGYVSGAGTVSAADSILGAFQKINGNDALKAPLASPTFTGTVSIPSPFNVGGSSVTVTASQINAVTAKANIASPTFTGTVTTDVLTVGGQLNLTGDLIKSRSESGANSLISMTNTSNTANSGAEVDLVVAGTSAGDPFLTFAVSGAAFIALGIDNSDSDKFKISNSLALGSSDALAITTAGVVEFPNGVTITGGAGAVGRIFKGATNGLAIRGDTGSANDFVIFDAAQTVNMLANPTGTAHINIGGSFGRGAPVTKTSDFSVGVSENWLICNKGSSCVVTLPSAAAFPGREIGMKNLQSFTVVSATSNVVPLVGGAAGTAIMPATPGAAVMLISDAANWIIMR